MRIWGRLMLGALGVSSVGAAVAGAGEWRAAAALPRVVANDNRAAAGVMRGDTLRLALGVGRAAWYPEAEDGPFIVVEAFGEEGGPPRVPAPLIRVRTGTPLHIVVRNTLPDSTIHVIGLGTHPVPLADTVHLAPGERRELRFAAGAPGTYLYRAVIGGNAADRESEHEAAAGAFVIDPPDGSPRDRVFVMNIAGEPVDSTTYRNALAIDGRAWPYTELLDVTVGDTVRWRVLNGTARSHPMHLHGFYFRIGARGDGNGSADVPEQDRSLAVTELMRPWMTRTFTWSPDRPGNWLFHCHLTFHVVAEDSRLDAHRDNGHRQHSSDPREHMAGLVLGIRVAPRPGASYARAGVARRFDLYVHERTVSGRRRAMSYILQQGATPPAPDSVRNPGSLIVLTRGEPADIVVHNRTREPTAVHWHGIELDSWSDGVAGWSNRATGVAPPVMPGDSFVARLELARAGTFIYHTHLNDIAQVTSGLVGPLVVLEPGERFDPARDHVFLANWSGPERKPLLVNGDSTGKATQTLSARASHRFRFINIGPANAVRYELRHGGVPVQWRALAKDGADLPVRLQRTEAAVRFVAVGETYDFGFAPPAPGEYELVAAFGVGEPTWRQRLVFR